MAIVPSVRAGKFHLDPLSHAAALLVAASVASASARPQPPEQAAPARFEVASVKPSRSDGVLVFLGPSPGRYQVTNVSLRTLIRAAFRLQSSFQLVNAPDWTENERFDINARFPEGVRPPAAVQDAMLRTLLAERFTLVTHRETRELPVYALVLASADGKVPPGLQPAPPECAPGGRWSGPGPDGRPKLQLEPGQRRPCGTEGGSGSISSGGITMASFASVLSARMGRTVLDRTGLDGLFELDLKYTPDQANAGGDPVRESPVIDPRGPSLVTALREQLGLKLESTRAPVEVLVIDSVDRPTPD